MNLKTARRGYLNKQGSKSPIRLTALLYLKEALREERYEECKEIISIAYEFGATTDDISGLLEDNRREPR